MDTQRWELAGNIFERLLGAPREERKTLLDSICGEDAELRNIVVSMLDSESSAVGFEKALAVGEHEQTTPTDEGAPANRQVGPWRLEHELGSGGMGVVWMAERADGQFEQRAALKLIKRGMDSDAVLKRFLRERQILARLEHPNIAHLLDGGIASDGRPYFAMEYVEGLPLLRYCHEQAANLETRIRLFLDVCNAVQFAHTHHVVHRDLKPSNVLVTRSGAVKLLDFGIAKLLATEDSGVETITHLQRERPMTPAYAAPEQIRGGTISPATDIYALGCMLYELMTGQRAYDFAGATDARDVLKIIEATDPVAPSRLKILSAPIVLKRLRGDLDTIVLTALKHDPARRYPNVAAFATDLRNYLTGKPISARRDSVFYRGYKFVRRHRVGVAAALAVLAIAVTTIFYEMRLRAPPTVGSALAIVEFGNPAKNNDVEWIELTLKQMLATEFSQGGRLHVLPNDLVRGARTDISAQLANGGYSMQNLALLRKRLGADYVLSGSYFVSGITGDSNLRIDLSLQDARNNATLANIAENGALADLPLMVAKAGVDLRAALGFDASSAAERQAVALAQPPSTDIAKHMGIAIDALHRGDPARARDELKQAVAIAPGYAPANAYLAQAWKSLGYDTKAMAAAEQAAAHIDGLPREQQVRIRRELAIQKGNWTQVLDLDSQLLAADKRNPELRFEMIRDLVWAGKLDQANDALNELRALPGIGDDPRIEIQAALIAQSRGDTKTQAVHSELALRQAEARGEATLIADAMYDLGIARKELGENEQAEVQLRAAIVAYQRLGNPRYEADSHLALANLLSETNRGDDARAEYQNALNICKRIGYQRGEALVYSSLMPLHWARGDRDAAETAARLAQSIYRDTDDRIGQLRSLASFAGISMDDAASDKVVADLREALKLSEQEEAARDHAFILGRLADALHLRGELVEARKVCDQAEKEAEQIGEPSRIMSMTFRCASIALDEGQVDAAVERFTRFEAGARKSGNGVIIGVAEVALAQIDIGRRDCLRARDRLTSAVGHLAEGDDVADEAMAQGLRALCFALSFDAAGRDAALVKARELRNRITQRRDLLRTDIVLSHVAGLSGASAQPINDLKLLADEAESRYWIPDAFEARLAALALLKSTREESAATLQREIATTARSRGFGWILMRLKD